ncbi:hypothetical protein ABEW05_001247 [Botrytis cinerea]
MQLTSIESQISCPDSLKVGQVFMILSTEPTHHAIQQSNGDVTNRCRHSRRIILSVRNRNSRPSSREENSRSNDHTPMFYAKEHEANSDNLSQEIQHHRTCATQALAILESDTERSPVAIVGNDAGLMFSEKVLQHPSDQPAECSVWGDELYQNELGDEHVLQSSVYGVITTTNHRFADDEVGRHDTWIHAKCNIDHQQIVRSYRNPAFQNSHRRNRICINLCAVPGLIISSYALSKYVVQTSLPTMKGTMLHRNFTGFPIIDHPSSTTFVSAALVYGMCSMSMYRANSHHPYQQHMVFLFIVCGIIFQLFRYPSLNEALAMAAAATPGGVTIALVVSMIGHFWSPSHEEVVFQDLIKKVEKMVHEGEMNSQQAIFLNEVQARRSAISIWYIEY